MDAGADRAGSGGGGNYAGLGELCAERNDRRHNFGDYAAIDANGKSDVGTSAESDSDDRSGDGRGFVGT